MANYISSTRLSSIKSEIRNLIIENSVSNIKEYKYTGKTSGLKTQDLILLTIIYEIIEDYKPVITEEQDGVINLILEEEFIKLINQVFKKYPFLKYPL